MDFGLTLNRSSAKTIQYSCQKCVMGVRRDIFRLIVLLGFVFILKVFRLSAKVSRAFDRKKSASCQIYNLCELRKILKDLNFKIFLKVLSPVFFKMFPALKGISLESIFYVSGGTIWFFIGVCRVLKLTRFRLNEVNLLAHKLSRLSKLQTTRVEEVLIVFFCADWTFRFSKFLWFWAIFFAFWTKKNKTGC